MIPLKSKDEKQVVRRGFVHGSLNRMSGWNGLRTNLLFAATLFLFGAGGLIAQSDRCADCHVANEGRSYHLLDWQLSSHSKKGVGCAACHGGDSTTFEHLLAHKGVLSSSDPMSPTHFTNLPTTCGECHGQNLKAFEKSRHGALVKAGDMDAPNCSTCHTSVGAFLLSSRGIERKCRSCHGEKAEFPRPGRPEFSRALHERFRELAKTLDGLERIVDKVADSARRAELLVDLRTSQGLRRDAAARAHTFQFVGVQELLDQSEERAELLTQRLAGARPATELPKKE